MLSALVNPLHQTADEHRNGFLSVFFSMRLHTNRCTVNPLYNDIRYNSKTRSNVNLVCTKISGSCIFSLTDPCYSLGWLVGFLGAERPFETVFQSISGRLPERGRKKREVKEERKNVQKSPTRTYCKL